GTTFSDGDSFNGGAGSDTVVATVGNFTRKLNTSNVETATISFADSVGAELDTTGSTVTTYNLLAVSANADITVNGIIDGATVNLTASADAADAVTLDAASGAQSMTIVAGSASGNVGFDLAVTDVANVTLRNVAGTATNAGTLTIATASFDSDTRSIAVNAVTGTGAIAFTDLLVGGATAVTITSNASGGITLGTGISGSALKSVSLVQNGSADIVGETIEGSGLTSITLDANAGGNIYLRDTGSGIELGNNSTGSTQASVTVSMNAETNSDIGTAASGASGVAINTTGSIALAVNIDASQASAGVHAGIITVALGGASAETTGTTLTVSAGSLGTGSIVRTETMNIDGMTGTQVIIGAVTQGVSSTFVLASGGIDATNVDNVDVQGLAFNLGQSAIAEIGAVTTTAGALNSISVVAADGASATFGAVVASAMGAVSVSVASGASANFGAILTSGSAAGTIVGAVGSIELNGSDNGGVTFGTIGASAVGAIAVSGALDVTFGAITANRIGAINTTQQGASGAFTINLSGVSAAAELTLGAATNVVISGKGNDSLRLLGGRTGATGNDTITFNATAQGTDNIINFIAGAAASGGDVIRFGTGLRLMDGSGEALPESSAGEAMATAISFTTIGVSAASAATAMQADDNVVVITGTAFANWSGVIDYIGNGKSGAVSFVAPSAAGVLAVVWGNDAGDTVVSLATVTAGVTVLTTGISAYDLAVLAGVTPGALVAANFDIAGS
ncbi:MAG: beta strand repeat-containing protein, partial [Limnohabitans sp.]